MFKFDCFKFIFNFILECFVVLGMSNGVISKSQIMVSFMLVLYGLDMVWLNFMLVWCVKV